MNFYFKITRKDIIMTEQDEEHYKIYQTCRFCEKEILINKVRDQCPLTGSYRGPAHNKFFINVTQKQCNFMQFVFHIFIKYDCHLFFQENG